MRISWNPLIILWKASISLGVIILVASGYWFRDDLFTVGIFSLWFYGIFTLTHFVLQMIFAAKERNRWEIDLGYQPNVGVMITGHREGPLFVDCVQSVHDQTYLNIVKVVFTEDEDTDTSGMRQIFERIKAGRDNWVYKANPNGGKREAMYSGFAEFRDEDKIDILVLMDSDTEAHPDAVTWLIQPFADERIGCATGDIGVVNHAANLLTTITNLRYWLAFNLERAAQSHFGVMTCVSGPLGAYRRSIIEEIKDPWHEQTFLGKPCTFGDDRHLTNLTMGLGYQSVYVRLAKALTEAPEGLWKLINQQLRWSKSFVREFILSIKEFRDHKPWLAFDLTYQMAFPIFVAINIGFVLYFSFTRTPWFLFAWLSILVFFGFIRAAYGAYMTRNPRFFLFITYSFLYVFGLLPLKFWAIFTVANTKWGTAPRGTTETAQEENDNGPE